MISDGELNLPKMALEDDEQDSLFSKKQTPANSNSKTPVLDTFGRDLTKMGEEGKLDPVVGRVKEIERVSQILSRRKKNNPILIGEPGTGKSSIAEGLALRIVEKKCSRTLFNKRVVMLDLASLVSGTKYRGQFEERIKALMMEVEKNPDVILFIDEIHTIIGAGSASGSLDASNMFKPALARGEIQIIGATTLDEYRKHIEKDGALERRFQKVMVEPASPEETLIILNNIKQNYESHHNVIYTEDAVKACVDLTSRYMADRFLPDKAIDALDEAGARVHISNIVVPKEITEIEGEINEIKEKKSEVVRSQRYEEAAKLRDVEKNLLKKLDDFRKKWEEEMKSNKQVVNEDNVAEVVSMMTGIPLQKVTTNENSKLQNMFNDLKGKVIGQDEAVKKIVKAIQRGRVGLKDARRPIFSGLLIGNSGVGKTELAKQLAKLMFDSEDSLIRLDMSEYSEKFTASKIAGAAPGYVGYDEGSSFLQQVRNKPYSVVLLDEIEKADPSIFNLFLQMLDDGQLTESSGRKVNFKNCVILMTSNVGTKVAKDFGNGVGFTSRGNKEDLVKDLLSKELKKKFAPEFINRIDEIIYFKDLEKEDIRQIIEIELNKFHTKLKEIGFTATVEDSIKEQLVETGFDPQYGARPLKRAIQRSVDDAVTEFIIENNPTQDSHFILDYDKENEITIVTIKEENKKKRVSKKKSEN